MRKPFIIYRRTSGKKRVYHVGFWDNERKDYVIRRSADAMLNELQLWGSYSTTSKADVEALAREYMERGKVQTKGQSIDFIEYLKAFWQQDGKYIKRKAARGEVLSPKYIQSNYNLIENHIKPYFDTLKTTQRQLRRITSETIEECLSAIYEKTGSARRVNVARQAMGVALAEALKTKLISDNPMMRVDKYKENTPRKGVFTMEEARKLLLPDSWTKEQYRVINLLAASTGLRMGECRGLRKQYLYYQQVGENQIPCVEVAEDGNWQDGEGLKEPKWGSVRIVPVPETVYDACLDIADSNPWDNEFVFFSNKFSDRPIDKHTITNALNAACDKIGIKDRRERRLSFHSWRHWYDTIIAGELPGEVRRQLTGHTSEKMDKRYIHFTDEHRKMLSTMGNGIFN